ncbi:MAG: MotA/TolQ/ExbB proton channel family protein [Myxococcota bacterium]|nr:MotA/TolQ/ExbB proton channel family protein [Myxococcota bacterium]
MLAELMRTLVDALAAPTIFALLLVTALSVLDAGAAIGERLLGLARLAEADPERVTQLARRRIERADLLARVGPMLGLMGTLIPLGPGLAALGQGNVALLADAVTVAFDTTVLGLLVGVIGFVLSRLRRRWYDRLLDTMEVVRG